jgi:hypothetical protein
MTFQLVKMVLLKLIKDRDNMKKQSVIYQVKDIIKYIKIDIQNYYDEHINNIIDIINQDI